MSDTNASVADFILNDPRVQANPYPFYPLLRDEAPVLKSEMLGQPCYVLSRRKDITAALMDPKTFSSRTAPIASLLFADPPEHGRLRKMVADKFTRLAVAPMVDAIAPTARKMFSRCLEMERFDGIVDFASPLTIYMMGRLLGIAVEQVENVRGLTHLLAEYALAVRVGRTPSDRAQAANSEITNLFLGLAETGDHTADGVMAVLAQNYRAGELDANQLVRFAILLFGAGHTTTTNLIGNSLFTLTQRPGDLARMRREPTFIEPCIEEVLRTRPSFHRIVRITTREVRVAETVIPEGAIVRLLLASANRDPQTFPDGETFDPDREARMHSAFGQGIHSCLGSWLARLESRTAFGVVCGMTSEIVLDPEVQPTPLTGGTFNEFGFEHLPLKALALADERDGPE